MGETDLISRQAAIDALEREKTYCTAFRDGYTPINVFEKYNAGLTDGIKALKNLPSAQPKQDEENDLIPRQVVKYICRKETVSTNPDDHKHRDHFIDFMDDEAVADFGRWQWANGFNTALVTVKVELDKVPSWNADK